MEIKSLENELNTLAYHGRGIIIGKSVDGKKAITAYLPEQTFIHDWMRNIDAVDYFNDFFKDLTLTPDNDWQRDELEEFLENLDTEYPSLNSVKAFADRHGIRQRQANKINN